MSLVTPLKGAYDYLKSLAIGLGITGKYFIKPTVTVYYPYQEVDNLSTYRGHVELIPKDDDPNLPRCIACGSCARACPSNCLTVACAPEPEAERETPKADLVGGQLVAKAAKAPAKAKCKTPGIFYLDYSLCSLCGLCAKSCPVDSLRFSQNVYFVAGSRDALRIDLMARMRRRVAQGAFPRPAATAKPPTPSATEKE